MEENLEYTIETPTRKYRHRVIHNNKSIVDFNSLKKDEFKFLGKWNFAASEENIGTLYRIGIKENIVDDEGDITDLVVFFSVAYGNVAKYTDEDVDAEYSRLRKVMQLATISHYESTGQNILSAIARPINWPDWMIVELKEYLKSNN